MRPATCEATPATATPTDYATDDRRAAALTSSRVRFMRARRVLGEHKDVARTLGVSTDAVQLWETAKRKVPAWALVLVEELAAATPARAKHLPIKDSGALARPALEAKATASCTEGARVASDDGGKTPGLARLDQRSGNDGCNATQTARWAGASGSRDGSQRLARNAARPGVTPGETGQTTGVRSEVLSGDTRTATGSSPADATEKTEAA